MTPLHPSFVLTHTEVRSGSSAACWMAPAGLQMARAGLNPLPIPSTFPARLELQVLGCLRSRFTQGH